MLRTGFWGHAERELVHGCVYLGCSAGAIVAGRSISTAYWKGWDDPDMGIEWTEDSLRGRSLVDCDIFPHYDREKHYDLVESRKRLHSFDVMTITDNMALVRSVQEGIQRDFDFYSDGALGNVLIKKVADKAKSKDEQPL